MAVCGQPHAPAALSLGKSPPVRIEQEAGWAPQLTITLWSRAKFLSLLRIKSLVVQAQFGYYTDWAVPAPEMQGWLLITAGAKRVKNLDYVHRTELWETAMLI